MKRCIATGGIVSILMAVAGCSTANTAIPGETAGTGAGVVREDVVVESAHGKLYGTLEVPRGAGKVPVFLIIAGSGPTDRDGNSELQKGANNSLRMLGESLTAFGYAALRYDKRGVGESTGARGPVEETTFRDMVEDALLWFDLLASDPRFSTVGIIGHSEGSLVALSAASERDTGPVVSISGAGRPILEIIREQMKLQPGFVRKPALEIIGELEQGRIVRDVPKLLEIPVRSGAAALPADLVTAGPCGCLRGAYGSGTRGAGNKGPADGRDRCRAPRRG